MSSTTALAETVPVIESKTAFKRWLKSVDTSAVDWCMIGLATRYYSEDSFDDTLVDVQPLSTFRTNDARGTVAAIASARSWLDAATCDFSVGTSSFSPPAVENVLDGVFRWIDKRDFHEHANAALLERFRESEGPACHIPNHYKELVVVFDKLDAPIVDRGQAILRLLARSKGWVPHGYDLDAFEEGMFQDGALKLKVANTTEGPVLASVWDEVRVEMLVTRGFAPAVISCDWFMRLWDYYIPPAVRFCIGAEARLGASIGHGDGTIPVDDLDLDRVSVVMMKAAFMNYNSTAEGGNMIEGRVSTESTLKMGAKLGGGASTMGTIEGIDTPVTIHEGSLVGAVGNAGISLGPNGVIGAGAAPQAGQRCVPKGSPEFVAWVLSHRDPDTAYEGDDYVYGRDLDGLPGLQLTGPEITVRESKGGRTANTNLY